MSETGKSLSVFIRSNRKFYVDFDIPFSLSHPIRSGTHNPQCFSAPYPLMEPLVDGKFIGAVNKGSSVNFYNLFLNPHGTATHTECVGHINENHSSLNEYFNGGLLLAYLMIVSADLLKNGDHVIRKVAAIPDNTEALILKVKNYHNEEGSYSGTNPPYVSKLLINQIIDAGVQHLLVELPSIDKEQDEGRLEGHRAFWYPESKNGSPGITITELIRVPEMLEEGYYVLNLQVLNIALDVSPSNPQLYKVINYE